MSQFRWLIQTMGRLALLLGSALGGVALAADAPAPEPWVGRSDAVFHRVLTAPMSITDLTQDGQGFVWIATQYGLSRWDGYQQRN